MNDDRMAYGYMDGYHDSHDFHTAGDGQDEPFDTWCSKCWRSYDHYTNSDEHYFVENAWASKRCSAGVGRLLAWITR